MVRTLTVVVGIAMSLVAARETSAIPIQLTPVDLDSWVGGSSVIGSFDDFRVVKAPPPPPTPPKTWVPSLAKCSMTASITHMCTR